MRREFSRSEEEGIESALRDLKLARFRVVLRLESPLQLEALPIHALRGGLGFHLRQLHCHPEAQQTCSYCRAERGETTPNDAPSLPSLKRFSRETSAEPSAALASSRSVSSDCPYVELFHPVDEKMQPISAPFLISAPLAPLALKRDQLAFDLTLIGEARYALSAYVAAFSRMGDTLRLPAPRPRHREDREPSGLGTLQTPFRVESIQQVDAQGLCAASCVEDGRFCSDQPLELSLASWADQTALSFRRLVIETVSPLQLEAPHIRYARGDTHKSDRVFLQYLTVDDLFQQICRRLSNLLRLPFWSGEPMWTLVDIPPRLEFIEAQYQWAEEKKKHRENKSFNLSGLTGRYVVSGRPGGLWPFLQMGRFLQIGRRTTYGNGQFQIHAS